MMSPSSRLRILHVANHLVLPFAVIHGDWWLWGLSFLIWNFIGIFGISIGFHRLLSHRSFSTYRWFENACTLIGCFATGGSPLGWVGAHRMHHAFPDRPGDPHSPHVIGLLRSYLHLWGNVSIRRRFIKDIISRPAVKFTHRYYFPIVVSWAALLYLIHPLFGIFGYSIPAVFAFHAYSQINSLGHRFGYRTFDTPDSSRNNWIVNILTCGEGWHNNHHRFPNSYRIGRRWWEWDPSAFILEVFGVVRQRSVLINGQRGKN